MLNQKYFGLPLWVWLVVVGIVIYTYCQSTPQAKAESKPLAESKPKPLAESKSKEEKKEKFANISNSKLKIFNFNTEWCGWSKRFQPEWDQFAKTVKLDSELSKKVEVINVRCDDKANEQICEAYNVPGYPYVVVEVNGRREPYNGERTAKALLSFVSSK